MAAENPRVFVPQQFENEANPAAHREQTGQEILGQVDGPIDGFCSGIGTGGTITGIGETLKAANHVLDVKKLHKPTGTAPGFVTYDREKTIRVTPDEAVIKSRKISK